MRRSVQTAGQGGHASAPRRLSRRASCDSAPFRRTRAAFRARPGFPSARRHPSPLPCSAKSFGYWKARCGIAGKVLAGVLVRLNRRFGNNAVCLGAMPARSRRTRRPCGSCSNIPEIALRHQERVGARSGEVTTTSGRSASASSSADRRLMRAVGYMTQGGRLHLRFLA